MNFTLRALLQVCFLLTCGSSPTPEHSKVLWDSPRGWEKGRKTSSTLSVHRTSRRSSVPRGRGLWGALCVLPSPLSCPPPLPAAFPTRDRTGGLSSYEEGEGAVTVFPFLFLCSWKREQQTSFMTCSSEGERGQDEPLNPRLKGNGTPALYPTIYKNLPIWQGEKPWTGQDESAHPGRPPKISVSS